LTGIMDEQIRVRMDQWLAAVRIFKTRSQAADACKKGKILINGQGVKSSHAVKPGETIELKAGPIIRTYRVLGLLSKRVSAKIAVDYVQEITPAEELEKLKIARFFPIAFRERGTGRPTKKERRVTDRLKKSPA